MNWIKERPEILVATFYPLTFVLALIPYYNWLYRVTVNLVHVLSFWASLLIIILTLIHLCNRRHRFKRVLLALPLGLLVLFAGTQVHHWRYSITDAYIENHYCAEHEPNGSILGGITVIKVEGIERTGAFENSSHCVLAPCVEEFYYCDDAAVVIGR